MRPDPMTKRIGWQVDWSGIGLQDAGAAIRTQGRAINLSLHYLEQVG